MYVSIQFATNTKLNNIHEYARSNADLKNTINIYEVCVWEEEEREREGGTGRGRDRK